MRAGSIPAPHNLVTETKWRQQPAALTQSVRTPCDGMAYILKTSPVMERKSEGRPEQKKVAGEVMNLCRDNTKHTVLGIYDALDEPNCTLKYNAGANPIAFSTPHYTFGHSLLLQRLENAYEYV
jgi:hypothetical protein